MIRPWILVCFGLVGLVPAAAAQSLFGTQGLGMPVEPLDARARALGNSGVGMLGPSLSPTDLASSARIFLPTGQITFQPQWVSVDLGDQGADTRSTRFPQMGLAYPVPALGGTAVLHIGAFLDQRWEVEESSVQELMGEMVPVNDRFRSDGGVSTVQLGWAQRIGEDLALGIGVGSRIGSVTRTFERVIESEDILTVVPFRTGGEWRYSGLTAHLGFQWDPIEAIRMGGSVLLSQDLKAESTDASDPESTRFTLPAEYRFGISGILTSRLAVTAGFTLADWKSSGEDLGADSLSGSVLSYGGGIEWAGFNLGIRNFPVRVGFKRAELPFTFDGHTPTEQVFAGGLGVNLLPPQSGLLGAIDMALERGTREAGSLSESFWRASFSVRVGSF